MTLSHSQTQGLCGLDGQKLPHPLLADTKLDAELTHPRREYLAEVYRLHASSDEPVTTTALAERLEVTPPAVVRMMRRLAQEGYLRRQPYKGVLLTAAGEREALKAIRRHRLLEAFLVTVMKFGWEEVHAHAHALEGVIDDDFENRMDEIAGFPARCPHGDPIPTREGIIAPVNDHPLLDCRVGATVTVRRVKTEDAAK
ncbi:MAG: metal-dependent transcriptional regulator, partial [Anaerolineales bacterium]|nr:metal-dependent transcriptional regulator [Anaerolineales bacterium]